MNYLIHSALLAFLFYGVYQLFLKNETFHQFKRAYLLLFPACSLLLPFITVGTIPVPELFTEPIQTTDTVIGSEQVQITNDQLPILIEQEIESLSYIEYAWMVYAGIAFVFLILFILKIAHVRSLIAGGNTKFLKNLFVTRVHESGVAFSFFNHVVLDEQFDEDITKSIVEHERIHIDQKHSWDLMFYEVLRVVFWFHPISHLAQKELQRVHEYIVDQKLAFNQSDLYQESLLAQTLGVTQISLVNSFNKKSNLKKRITMISKTKSQPAKLLKLLWIIPIVCASLIYTACTDDVVEQETAQQKKSEIIDLKDFKEGQVDFYKGLTEEEMAVYNEVKEMDRPPFFLSGADLSNEKMELYLRALVKIDQNGSSYAIDHENNDQLIKITERPDRDTWYSDVSEVTEMDIDEEVRLYKSVIKNLEEKGMVDKYLQGNSFAKGFTKGWDSTRKKISSTDDDGNEIVKETIVEEIPVYEDELIADVPFALIEQVPVYPGCENLSSNEERKKCMTEEISKFVNRNFNTGLSKELNLKGTVKINVAFKIDENGKVVGVQSAAKHPKLGEEAKRVITSLPKMQPGEQRGEKVGVIYALPIIFEVQE